jgi:hypothetical protein
MKFVLEGIWSDFVVTILGDHMSRIHIRKYNAINFGIIPSTGSLPRHVPNNHKKTKSHKKSLGSRVCLRMRQRKRYSKLMNLHGYFLQERLSSTNYMSNFTCFYKGEKVPSPIVVEYHSIDRTLHNYF